MKICRVLLLFAWALCARAQNYTCNNISKAYSDASCCAVEDGDTELARGVAAVYCAYGDSICVEGQYTSTCAADNLICKDCPNGFFTDSTSRLQCTACGAGQFQNMPGQSACTECAAGLYENAAGSSECKQCQGSSSSAGSSDCPHCVSGTGMQGGECKACPSGWGSVGLGHFNNSCKMFVEANPGYMLGGRCGAAFDPECSYALTGEVTSMHQLFKDKGTFNQDISAWNTAGVTSMREMFYKAAAFNQNIGTWDTAKVVDMGYMFFDAKAFNQDIGSWNTAALQNTDGMFGAEVITCYKTSSGGGVPTSSGRLCPRMQMDNFCVQQPDHYFVANLCMEQPWPPEPLGSNALSQFLHERKNCDCGATFFDYGDTYEYGGGKNKPCMLKAVALDGAWDILVDADSPLWPGAFDISSMYRRRRGVY